MRQRKTAAKFALGTALILILVRAVWGIQAGTEKETGAEIVKAAFFQAAAELFESAWNPFYPSFSGEQIGWEAVFGREKEPDPAYRSAKALDDFYEEHQYLALYGDEETGMGENGTEPGATGGSGDGTEDYGAEVSVSANFPGQVYQLAQLEDFDFLMSHFYSVHTSTTAERGLMDARKLLSRDFCIADGAKEGPQILIYHTHSQEAFADSGEGENIVEVGAYLAELLEEKGLSVYHDRSVYDVRDGELDRNKAYTYALEGITGILEENPSIQVVIDLHRDGVDEGTRLVTEINGKPTAKIMYFNGLSRTRTNGDIDYLYNPYIQDNLAFSLQMQLASESLYPGFVRHIYLRAYRYNLHLLPKSLLVEAGAQTNTVEEMRNAMEVLADTLAHVILE